MSQHLNRLNNEEVVEFDKAFEKFCKVENQENKMKVYLVEKVIGKRLETIAIKTNWEIAQGLIGKDEVGIVTEMEVDLDYLEGIGECQHWHFDPDEKDEDGNRLDDVGMGGCNESI